MAESHVFTRDPRNPIVGPQPVPGATSVFNSAVVPFQDRYAGVFRVDPVDLRSELHVGRSPDGICWDIDPGRIRLQWDDPDMPATGHGYDPRITQIEGTYYLTWCNDYHGPTIGLAETRDFVTFRQLCNAVPPYNRNAVLFPRRIGGAYAMLHRPSDRGHTPFGDIFYSTSPDLVHWGRHRFVFGTRDGWQSTKVGAGPPPIETQEGWLLIYHGVRTSCSGFIYCAGGALLDLDKPWKVLYRTRNYLMAPREPYERVGDVPNVVFPNAAILDESGRLALYYGCADTCVGVAYAQLEDLVRFIKENSY